MADQQEMIKYFNVARQFPAYFINLIDKQLENFINDKELPINEDMIYQTNQGKRAWKEARKYLERQAALPALEVHQGLNMAAKDHAKDLSKNKMFGHTGADKSTFSERILRYCKKGQGSMAEIIGADFYLQDRNYAQMTMLGLIVDDGVSDRGHRKTIFNPQYRFVGCKSQIQNDKLITVFELTENKLQIRGQQKSNVTNQESNFGNSTSACYREVKTQDRSHIQEHKSELAPKKENRKKDVFEELNSNIPSAKFGLGSQLAPQFKSQFSGGKKVSERKQNTRIFYEQNSKTTQKYTQVFYSDGTRQQNIQRHTVFN